VNGALTYRVSFMVLAGYAAGFYAGGDEYDGIVGQVEMRWNPTPGMRFAFGYDRDFFRSLLGNFHRRDRGYARGELLMGGSFLLGVEGSAGLYAFGTIVDGGGTPIGGERSDVRVEGALFAEYRVADWFALNASLGYVGDFTDYELRIAGVPPDPGAYQKFEAWAGARVFY
ncbi:MAG: hypothetical protein RMK74_17185, partial [Myxococcales bacterium]|nr:hypothetical protein [Myxococcales bacterium]